MITIKHNFDETKFMWLWARYVKSGNIEKHCVNSIPGQYSKKFSGASNHDLLSQPILVMDEVPDGQYEAIYFCGVLKAGYLNKNSEKNNYRHNVHFVVHPAQNASDVWDFENWHVEIENGYLEQIPPTYLLRDQFFKSPYDSHYYTCRIFRWMVGHFYPNQLKDILHGYPEKIINSESHQEINTKSLFLSIIDNGYQFAKAMFEEDWWVEDCLKHNGIKIFSKQRARDYVLRNGLFNRIEFAEDAEMKASAGGADWMDYVHCRQYIINGEEAYLDEKYLWYLFQTGIEEFLETLFPYQDRRFLLY